MSGTPNRNKYNAILGAAGEHFVMSKILLLDLVACIAPQGAPGVDIVISDPTGNTQCAVQVKSQRRKEKAEPRSWTMGAKSELNVGPKLFYCFVSFSDVGSAPISYIVPSDVVANYAKASHKNWLNTPGRQGQDHKDNSMRKFDLAPRAFDSDVQRYFPGWADQYRENWDLILECVTN
jgi:hypothetical protein